MRFTTKLEATKVSVKLLSIKQRYKLNAIHNSLRGAITSIVTIVNKAKIQIECDSQRVRVIV